MTPISELVARALVVGNLEIQVKMCGALSRRAWQRKLDAATDLLVDGMHSRHVNTPWRRIDGEYRERASFDVDEWLERMLE